jgi:heme exporter protein C
MQSLTQKLANPTQFMRLSGAVLPWLWIATGLLLIAGLYMAANAPPDYQHGHTVKIMFVHVPSAWIALAAYALIAASSFGFLVFRHPLADVSARAAAPIGAVFTLLALVTGSLWGKPGWGTFWVWDARLTSVLILFFLYLGLIALRSSFEDDALAANLTAILAVAGIVMLPIIRYSVTWWATLHQPSTGFTSTVHPSLRWPLLTMAAAFLALFLAMHLKAMRNDILRRRVKALALAEVRRANPVTAE